MILDVTISRQKKLASELESEAADFDSGTPYIRTMYVFNFPRLHNTRVRDYLHHLASIHDKYSIWDQDLSSAPPHPLSANDVAMFSAISKNHIASRPQLLMRQTSTTATRTIFGAAAY